MEFLSNKPLLITDTILRDAHQSQAATRMTTEDMLPALEMLDSIGYYSLECWGGATFDACMRFLNEDPWERLRTIRQHVKHTKLQMLFRGQNILGYKHYADDVVEELLFLAHFLSMLGIVPEIRVLNLAVDFFETARFAIDVKDTPEVRSDGA